MVWASLPVELFSYSRARVCLLCWIGGVFVFISSIEILILTFGSCCFFFSSICSTSCYFLLLTSYFTQALVRLLLADHSENKQGPVP